MLHRVLGSAATARRRARRGVAGAVVCASVAASLSLLSAPATAGDDEPQASDLTLVQANIYTGLSTTRFQADVREVLAQGPDFVTYNEVMFRQDSVLAPDGYGIYRSMRNRYTAAKKPRSEDAYTPGGEHGYRPDYATTVYTQCLKKLFPDVPVMIGGIEASLRRVTHYDYWSDTLKPSILAESGADLLVYGMGRTLTYQDRFAVESLVEEAKRNDYRVRDMIVAVCKSDLFVGRTDHH